MAGTKGIGVFGINSKFASGSLVFYEKTVGRTATGDVLTIGTDAVTIGGTAQDVDFQFYGTGSLSAIIDTGLATLALTGITATITRTLSGASSLNVLELAITDATTSSSGYAHGIHLTYGKSGATSGGASNTQYNAVGVDYTISGGGSSGYNAFYCYSAKSGSPDLSAAAVFGANLEMTEMGATDYFGCLWLNKYNTTLGAIDAFILMSNQGSGVTRDAIRFQSKPTNFIGVGSAFSGGCWNTTATVGAQVGRILVDWLGTQRAIPVYALS